MTDRVQIMRNVFCVEKKQKNFRQEKTDLYHLAERFAKAQVSDLDRATERLCYVLKNEKPVLFDNERIAFTRTVTTIPELFTESELAQLRTEHWLHEKGDVCNINVDYTKLLSCGFDAKIAELTQQKEVFVQNSEHEKAHYMDCQIAILDAIQDLSNRYQALAVEQGNAVVAATLAHVPAKAPRNFLEALQMFRILHFTMWCGRNYHNTIGRFDQYMYPYFKRDMDAGIYTEETALELLEEFFLTFNKDSDLYPGMQQGDNGQSMVLGGKDSLGRDCYNKLSELCLKASLELRLIDPKINLRVHKDTPLSQYILGTELTKQGLGFPQYSNDDVIIPGLIDWGYSEEDAYNYVVAACWEFIVPGKALDIPNIEALSFAAAVEKAVIGDLQNCENYSQLFEKVVKNMEDQINAICDKVRNLYVFPAPFISLMTEGCVESGQDISFGSKYNNYGIHGTGLATAADSLAAVRKFVFEEKSVDKDELIEALRNNFSGYELLRNKLRYEAPKMGNDDDSVDTIAVELLEKFADCLAGRVNERGGIFRAGTGSAMYYVWHSQEILATPDGRDRGENLACNYSPSLFSKCKGPVSIIHSFAKPNLQRVANGGPLTLELHDTVFRNEDSIQKVALLVKSYFDLGGHQLQINAVNRQMLLDAQIHPEQHRNLIVRVWGWSGYFVELDKIYQDHIIQRMELQI